MQFRNFLLAGVAGVVIGCAPAEQPAKTDETTTPPTESTPTESTEKTETTETAAAREIEITADDFRFSPETITASPGERLRVVLVNSGGAPHNIEFELPSGEVELENPIEPGDRGTLEFEAPEAAGEYRFYCPVGNHEERGMVGTLTVE